MRRTLADIKAMVEARGLDRLVAFDSRGRKVEEAEGTKEIIETLDNLERSTPDWIHVTLNKYKADSKDKRSWEARSFHAEFKGTGEMPGAVGATRDEYGGRGPTWREFFDLKLENMRKEVEEQNATTTANIVRELSPAITMLIGALGKKMIGGSDAAPAPIAAPTPRATPDAPDSPMPMELRVMLANVVKVYRNNPDVARQYAPAIEQLANQAPSTTATDDAA